MHALYTWLLDIVKNVVIASGLRPIKYVSNKIRQNLCSIGCCVYVCVVFFSFSQITVSISNNCIDSIKMFNQLIFVTAADAVVAAVVAAFDSKWRRWH